MAKASPAKIRFTSSKSDSQPATRKMLRLVRDELKHDIRRLETKFDARFSEIDARFSEIDARFSGIEARFTGIDSRFEGLESRLSRMELLLEEQTTNNRIVLEGLQALWQMQDRSEDRLDSKSRSHRITIRRFLEEHRSVQESSGPDLSMESDRIVSRA